jgi:hypothetical protein
LEKVELEKHKTSIDHELLKSKYQIMEKQYFDLEDKYGKTVSGYEIKI